MTRRTSLGWAQTSTPATRTSPPSGRNSVATALMKVVLPAPLGPSSAVTWPDSATRSRPSSARTSPKLLVTLRASMMGVIREAPRGRRIGGTRLSACPPGYNTCARPRTFPFPHPCRSGGRNQCREQGFGARSDRVRAGVPQLVDQRGATVTGPREPDHPHAGGRSRGHAGRAVFDDDTTGGVHIHHVRHVQKEVWCRLASCDATRREHMVPEEALEVGHGERGSDAIRRARRCDTPAVHRPPRPPELHTDVTQELRLDPRHQDLAVDEHTVTI